MFQALHVALYLYKISFSPHMPCTICYYVHPFFPGAEPNKVYQPSVSQKMAEAVSEPKLPDLQVHTSNYSAVLLLK